MSQEFEAQVENVVEEVVSNTKEKKLQNDGIMSLVFGVIGLIIPSGLITGIIALVFAQKTKLANGGMYTGLGIAGLICGIASLVVGAIFVLFLLLYVVYVIFGIIIALFATGTMSLAAFLPFMFAG